jgi:hypothetical protein
MLMDRPWPFQRNRPTNRPNCDGFITGVCALKWRKVATRGRELAHTMPETSLFPCEIA